MKCVMTDYVEPDLDYEVKVYKEAGIQFDHTQLRAAISEELADFVKDADVIVVDQAKIDKKVLKAASQCKLIIRHGDGFENVDIKAAAELGIAVANKPGFWSTEVAEQALSLGLCAFRRITEQVDVARNPRTGTASTWDLKSVFPFRGLSASTLGIVGFGKIGSRLAKMASTIFKTVIVYDPKVDDSLIEHTGAVAVSFDDLLKKSHVISIHTPLSAETKGLFSAKSFAKMEQNPVLVNTARGGVVHTGDLVEALKSGQIAAAALDTTDPEPLALDHPLRSMDRVILTPHLGWYSETSMGAMRESIVKDVIAFKSGKLPESVVNAHMISSEGFRI